MLSPIAAIVQRHDKERFLTALFVPAGLRDALCTLYAFNHEIARAREAASLPMLALIRLQWWREVVEGAERRHEVASPVRAAVAAGVLDREALLGMIEAREMEAEESLDAGQLAGYLGGSAGTLMREAGRLLGAEASELAALERLGVGCGAVGLLRNRAAHAAQGRWSAPETDCRDLAAAWLGAPRQWSAVAAGAALPAVFARRRLRGVASPAGDSVALWLAARRRLA